MSKLLLTPSHSQKKERMSVPNPKPTNLFITSADTPFDDSIYDSNQNCQPSTETTKIHQSKLNPRRTQ